MFFDYRFCGVSFFFPFCELLNFYTSGQIPGMNYKCEISLPTVINNGAVAQGFQIPAAHFLAWLL